MTWLSIGVLAAFLWSVVNHIDKYILTRHFTVGGTGALLILTSLFSAILLPIAVLIEPGVFRLAGQDALLLLCVGALNAAAIYFLLAALREDEASIVIPLLQTIPVFGYVFGFVVLGETLTTQQVVASLIILAGAFVLSLELDHTKPAKIKGKAVLLMLAASFIFALFEALYKFVTVRDTFWVSNFWQYAGLSLTGLLLFVLKKSYRVEFLHVMRANRAAIIGLALVGETLNLAAGLLLSFATLLTPLALAQLANAYQPVFVFLIGAVLSTFFPHISQEKTTGKYLVQKIVGVLLIFAGSYLIYR